MSDRWLTVLESDWGEEGDQLQLHSSKSMVGPVHTYREIFRPLLNLFEVKLDHAFFDAPGGVKSLLSRFNTHRHRKVLCIAAHGSPKKIYTSGGEVHIWELLRKSIIEKKEGVLFASCKLGAWGKEIENLLEQGNFDWIAAYRESASYLSAVQTEVTFWKCYFDGWGYYKIESLSNARYVPLKVNGKSIKGDAVACAIATYLLQPASVALRFDVRKLNNNGDVISALEIFNKLIVELGYSDKELTKIETKNASQKESEKYRYLVERLWNNQWEWWPAD